MKKLVVLFIFSAAFFVSEAQSETQKAKVEKACMNYIEGFYEGDVSKLQESLQPKLYKFGFWKNKESGEYMEEKPMTYDDALAYAKNVLEKKRFANPKAQKIVEIFDIGHSIAAAKVTAWWGIDYMLLSKRGDKWMIEQVIWEGPLEKLKS